MRGNATRLIFCGMFTCLSLLLTAGLGASQAVTIINAEFFIDHDPGHGHGTPLPPADGTFDGEEEDVFLTDIPVADLQPGLHVVYVRTQNSDGFWAEPSTTSLMILDGGIVSVSQVSTIAGAEYFIDQDPGEGNG